MKYEILGFNQQKAVALGLNLKDLALLNYISDAISSPATEHILRDGYACVWLKHDKILTDLPILDIKERSLIEYTNKLKRLGLIKIYCVCNDGDRGSKSYYALTDKYEALKYDRVQKIATAQRPSAENCNSDNSINNNTNKQQELFTIKKENSKQKEDKSDKVQKFVADYNSICKSLPKCQKVTPKRQSSILNILAKFTDEEILTVFTNLENSDFCKGDNDRGWKASIDFILSEEKFVRTLEGKYNGKPKSRTGKSVETTSLKEGEVARVVTKEEKEELRRMVERGELEEY